MKNIHIIILFLFILPFVSKGNKEDSLKIVIANTKNDSIKYRTQYKLGLSYAINGQFDSANTYLQCAKTGLLKKNYFEAAGYCLRDLGEIFMIRDMLDSAMLYVMLAEQNMRKAKSKSGLAKILATLGQLKTNRGEIKLAKKILWEAAELNKELELKSELGTVYQHLGGIYLIKNFMNLDSSLFYYLAFCKL